MEMRGGVSNTVTDTGQQKNDERTLKIELHSQWKLNVEFRNKGMKFFYNLF